MKIPPINLLTASEEVMRLLMSIQTTLVRSGASQKSKETIMDIGTKVFDDHIKDSTNGTVSQEET